MARRKSKKGRRGKAKPSLLSMAPIVMVGVRAYDGYKARGLEGAMAYPLASVSGYDVADGSWDPSRLLPFGGVLVGTYVAKKLVGMAGVNRALSGLPFRL